ncbi:WxL domain-containing protein [Vagococcus zengguangii]|uniref:WxL domain-containing protein n=1 Tax=Vagococcus zengguangii TaxID=2571750 RepID=A0A4D7CU88_9ENTE|nr:WxL domain-containing protein [Vagococcus zengguangii]QCI85880.1 WxL domain-containing protein [Vagococcus zengguangii]TLG81820.1 WxL domain-containing protein [Vagococcus zengguangii]
MKKVTLFTVLASSMIFGGAVHAEGLPGSEISEQGEITNPAGFDSQGKVIINEYTPDPTDPETTNPVDPLIPAPTDPTDPENPGTGDKHPLSIDQIANFTFTKAKQDGPVGIYNDSKIFSYNDGTTNNKQLVLQDGWYLNAENKLMKKVKKTVEGESEPTEIEVYIDESGQELADQTGASSTVYTDAKAYAKRIQVSDRRKEGQTYGWNLTLKTSPFENAGKVLDSTIFNIPMQQVSEETEFGSPISSVNANPQTFIGDATAGTTQTIANVTGDNTSRGTWVFSVADATMDVKDPNAKGTYTSTFNWTITEETPSETL